MKKDTITIKIKTLEYARAYVGVILYSIYLGWALY